jgi:hypothetical protein
MNRLSRCLDRLMPHLRPRRFAVTGGVAIQLGMAARAREWPRRDIADLDLVAASMDAIAATVVGPFLVSHYHVVGPGVPKFMIQLVDPVSRLRVDVFPDLAGSLVDATTVAIGDHRVPLLSLDSIFRHKLHTLSRASASTPVDPKHVRDARILGAVLGRGVPDVPADALSPDTYGIEADAACQRCALSRHPSWPLAPKAQIFERLGWNRPADSLRLSSPRSVPAADKSW